MWALHDSQQLCYCYLYEKPKNRLLKEILKRKKKNPNVILLLAMNYDALKIHLV